MNMTTRFFLYVLILNVVRYVVGMPIERVTISPAMQGLMTLYPNCFNADFAVNDFVISLFYNFVMWFAAVWMFHLAHPVLKGLLIWRSLKVFALLLLFYLGLSAVYMNHYTDNIKPFFLYSMLDGFILFAIVGISNGLLYRFFFKPRTARFDQPPVARQPPGQQPSKFPISSPRSRPQEPLSHTSSVEPAEKAPDEGGEGPGAEE